MAQIYSRIPLSHMQRGELLVYQAMQQLPQEWCIFHSCKEDYLEDKRHVHFEADFVLLIPGRGLLVVEVKDWPEMRLTNGRWESRAQSQGSWKAHTQSPLEQANIALQKLMRSLARSGCISHSPRHWPEHRHMAILTRGEPATTGHTGNLPFDTLYLCGAQALQQLQQRIEALFTLHQPDRMTPRHVARIKEALAPSVLFRMSLSNYLQEMDASAANLPGLLSALSESTGGIRVEGCAGTGKTVIACAEAARLAAGMPRDGRHRVLMLCFNHAMAHELQRHPLLAEQADILHISNFHDFCIQHILQPAGLDHLVNYHGAGDRLPQQALDAIESLLPGLPHYQAIFVDEAQDFRGQWWSIIQHLLHPDGKLYIFADKHQDLYDRYDQLPPLCTRLRLSTNLRNARQIADFSRTMLPAGAPQPESLPMSGAGIAISAPADSPQQRAAEVSRIIDQLLQNNPGMQRSDIVVLSPWRISHARCCLSLVPGLAIATPDETPDHAAARRELCRRPDADLIFASTIKSFKGQESAYIIVTDVIGLDESRGFDIKELYTACTRARFGLFIVPSTTGKSLVDSFLPSSSAPSVS